jgi:8-oxo-dGTP pyrophosphatase MutT (NUDIX family)
MNFEPQKFFIGLVDLFAVIMPGAALAYLTRYEAANWLALPRPCPLDTFERGAVFLFASYLLGHLISLLGSQLDDRIYKPLQKATDFEQIKHLATDTRKKGADKRAKLASNWLRSFVKSSKIFGDDADETLKHIEHLKDASLDRLSASKAVNAFQWSKIRLGKDHPAALLEVNRFEANSKFFRSFAVVLATLVIFYTVQGKCGYAAICLVLLFPALWRYINQRFKSIQQAYWSVLTIDAASAAGEAKPTSEATPSLAGGVVTRMNNGAREFLLITASRNNEEWVLPKGHIEAKESARFAAIREVYEETGYWTHILEFLDCSSLDHDNPGPIVCWYVMEFLKESEIPPKENRKRKWLPLSSAVEQAEFLETEKLLKKAAQMLDPPKSTSS